MDSHALNALIPQVPWIPVVVTIFHPCIFDRPAFSGLAFSFVPAKDYQTFFLGQVAPSLQFFESQRRYAIPRETPSEGALNKRGFRKILENGTRWDGYYTQNANRNSWAPARSVLVLMTLKGGTREAQIFQRTCTSTVRSTAIKFCMVTRVGRGVLLKGLLGSPNLMLTLNDQIGRGNTWGRACFRRSSTSHPKRRRSSTPQFLVPR